MAEELGFEGIINNSTAAVADRDFVVEALQWAATTMQHISCWAEDLVLYSTAEFGFVRLADAYSTGGSLMPQKKNPDSLELLHGKSGRMFGQTAGLMMTVKGLPSTYNTDLQESFEPMLDGTKTVADSIQITIGVLSTMTIFPEKMKATLSPDMLATDLTDYLVRKGVPFRETHHIRGRVVALAEREGKPMDQLSKQQLQEVDNKFGDDVLDCFNYERSVEYWTAKGGTSKASVKEQIEVINAWLKELYGPRE
jgi:argininosuccinate lyase